MKFVDGPVAFCIIIFSVFVVGKTTNTVNVINAFE